MRLLKNGNKPIIKKDDVVIIAEPNLPRSNWNLARVHEVINSKDGHIRGDGHNWKVIFLAVIFMNTIAKKMNLTT